MKQQQAGSYRDVRFVNCDVCTVGRVNTCKPFVTQPNRTKPVTGGGVTNRDPTQPTIASCDAQIVNI